jgi:hypothetical protein
MRLAVIFALFLPLSVAWAQEVENTGTADKVEKTDTVALKKLIGSNPEQFVARAAKLIYGHGGTGSMGKIDLAGLQTYVALQRAIARASAIEPLFAADLNGDWAVSTAEMTSVARAASADQRWRLMGLLAAADTDQDSVATHEEIMAFGQTQALQSFDTKEENEAYVLLQMDIDRDGFVTMDEVQTSVLGP